MLPIPLFANSLTRMILILAIHGFAMFFACLPVSEYARAEQPLYMNGDQSDQVEGTQIQGQLFHDGLKRTYLLYVPATLDQSKAAPLVMVFHGGFGSGSRIARHIGMNRVADREKFLVVYPDGVDSHWNDGRSTTASGADDVSFVLALIKHISAEYRIDQKRLYATGISNGGYLTQRLACELTDKIAAFAPVSSTMPVALHASCRPTKPVSMLMINGKDDPLVPWNGGELTSGKRMGGKGGVVISVPETFEFWRAHDGCSGEGVVTALPDTDPDDGTRVDESRYADCKLGSEVILLTIEGGGHTWPGSPEKPRMKKRTGRTSYDINASQVIWNFFKQHHL